MKDPCANRKRTSEFKIYYAPYIKAIEKQVKTPEQKETWKKLNTCSKMALVDKYTREGKFKLELK